MMRERERGVLRERSNDEREREREKRSLKRE